MSDTRMPVPATALDHESTIVAVVELSARAWLVGAQVAGVPRQCRQKLAPSAEGLLGYLDHLRRRAEKAGKRVGRIVVAYEAGRDGFWLARWLLGRGIEAYVIQPSSVPVDRRARRAKTDALDVEMLLRTTLAWLRGEPRVCSMVPIPSEVEEDGQGKRMNACSCCLPDEALEVGCVPPCPLPAVLEGSGGPGPIQQIQGHVPDRGHVLGPVAGAQA